MISWYSYFRSSAAFRVRIALNLKGLSYDTAAIPPATQRSEHARLSRRQPAGSGCRALEDGGQILIQSMAIMEYLDEVQPEPPLLPKPPADRGAGSGARRHRRPATSTRSTICACCVYLMRELGHDEAAIAKVVQSLDRRRIFRLSSRCSLRTPGPARSATETSPGLADIALVPQVVNAERYQLDLGPYPTLMRVYENCMKLGPFIAAHPSKQPDYEP